MGTGASRSRRTESVKTIYLQTEDDSKVQQVCVCVCVCVSESASCSPCWAVVVLEMLESTCVLS